MDKVELFGNIAHNLAPDAECFILGLKEDNIYSLEEIFKHVASERGSWDYIVLHDYITYNDHFGTLEYLAYVGMAGYHCALGGQISLNGIANQMTDLYKRKNSDYGNSFDKTLDRFGLVASAIRIGDKVSRLCSLLKKKGQAEVKDESIADTFMDLACYAIMTYMWMVDKNKEG